MKFGKRLAGEAARRWTAHYVDYKAIKKAIKDDIRHSDAAGSGALRVLLLELRKVSSFYLETAGELEARLEALAAAPAAGRDAGALARVRADISALIKFVALNYLAVVKAIKKRNRHFKAHFGEAAAAAAAQQQQAAAGGGAAFDPLHPLDLLSQEVFFTSNRLAGLATRAEVLSREGGAAAAAAVGSSGSGGDGGSAEQQAAAREALLQDYQCPVCLEVLRNPVVLTCAHRFCWGCLVAHYAAIRGPRGASAVPPPQQPHTHSHAHGGGCCGGGGSGSCGDKPQQQQQQFGGGERAGEQEEALVVLEKIVEAQDCEDSTYYACPLCRQPQVLNIESLQVDPHLTRFIEDLRVQLAPAAAASSMQTTESESGGDGDAAPEAARAASESTSVTSMSEDDLRVVLDASEEELREPEDGWLLPPQAPEHAGRLTVLLDLDGTLISSFTPKRAPRLPPSMRTHVVGQGSALNPGGVFVVERPGLPQFLEELASFAEVVVFTAGLEEYASPIIDAIDPANRFFAARVFREGTTRTEHYQCVKDMARAGRPLARTVLVDDTPLAFLHQPSNGVPVLGFRGDPDDRLLGEAVLPLLQTLAAAADVRPLLDRRFDMWNWFRRHGYPQSVWAPKPAAAAPAKRAASITAAAAPAAGGAVAGCAPAPAAAALPAGQQKEVLLLCDFDKTLTDFDAGERLVGELAPELAPQLATLQMPANFVPLTNDVLSEMQRRGVGRDALLSALQRMGAELPPASVRMLRGARARRVDVKVLSDCNSVFIGHVLAGARLHGCVQDVITNAASFERVAACADDAVGVGLGLGAGGAAAPPPQRSAPHRLVVRPRRGLGAAPHGCPLCPANLCKGEEVAAILKAREYRRVVFCGDGANDICPALSLTAADAVLARRGHALAAYLEAAAAGGAGARAPAAAVHFWSTHDELAALVEALTRQC